MNQITRKPSSRIVQKVAAAVSFASLTLVSSFGFSTSASASEMAPIIEFDGNVIASNAVHSEFGERPIQFRVELNPTPLSRVMTTNRAGYSFGGWSYAAGDPAVTVLQTVSHTTTRVRLFAVWNTKLKLDPNGGSGEVLSLDYRFGSNLALPAKTSYTKRGFEFAGWTSTPGVNIPLSTYRAANDAVGNQSVYASWKKTVSFASKGSTGAVPAPITHFEGGPRISLPTADRVSLSRPGYKFMGWSTTPRGKVVKNASSYLPKKAKVTLHAVWKKN